MGQVAGVAGDDGGLGRMAVATTMASTTSAVARAAQATPAARPMALVIGDDVAGFEDPGDWCWRSAAPGLGQDNDRDDRPDPRGGEFVVQGQEVGVAPFGGQQRTVS